MITATRASRSVCGTVGALFPQTDKSCEGVISMQEPEGECLNTDADDAVRAASITHSVIFAIIALLSFFIFKWKIRQKSLHIYLCHLLMYICELNI